MTRLTWDNFGERFYEIGIDRGVLYVDEDAGVAWSGIVSVNETPSGGTAKAFYMDGVKYLNFSDIEEFEGKLTAFYSPPEFDACDGLINIQPGLYAAHQSRKPFGLSYRTKVANDTDGENHAYKIHIIYNALADPTDHIYASLDDKNDAPLLVWSLTATPTYIPGIGWTAHYVVDTTDAIPYALQTLETILYGDDENVPRLPTAEDLAAIFEDAGPLQVLDTGNDIFMITGNGLAVDQIDDDTWTITADTVVQIDTDNYEISSEEV